MRQTRLISMDDSRERSTESSDDGYSIEDDPFSISLQMVSDPGASYNVKKAYQGMVDMLDDKLQVICTSDRSEFVDLAENGKEDKVPPGSIPCLATVLFFNPEYEISTERIKKKGVSDSRMKGLSKPDLLLNHMWNGNLDLLEFEKEVMKPELNGNTEKLKLGRNNSPSNTSKQKQTSSGRMSPFLRYDVILQESKDRELASVADESLGIDRKHIDQNSAEITLEARKQLETWPWEFHHCAETVKGISQCQNNAQDFYAYQPVQDVTRLYGDVIDTSKISRRKNLNIMNEYEKGAFIDLLDQTQTDFNKKLHFNENGKRRVGKYEYPLMGVREIHYGRQNLRYMLFVSESSWKDQVEFYRLLLRRHEVILREDFCFFTVYRGQKTNIQFALKKLHSDRSPISLSSTVMQFKVHNVGHLVPLLPHCCKPISDLRWQTKDHDGNTIILQIHTNNEHTDVSSLQCDRDSSSAFTSTSEVERKGSDDEYSLARLDSFVEPELPHRMPLLKPALYTNFGQHRFGRRPKTCSPSPGSSSSNSPERRNAYFPYSASFTRVCPDRLREFGSTYTLPTPRHSSTPTTWTSSSRFSESSDEPENTNFYRRAKDEKGPRRKSESSFEVQDKRKARHRSASRSRNRHKSGKKTRNREEEIVVYV